MNCAAVSISTGRLFWAALLIACYLHSEQVAASADADDGILAKQPADDANSQMDMTKRSWKNNLSMWGKRGNWQSLHGGWGKRDLWGPSSSFPLYVSEKRAWQNLQGGWGKRFAPEDDLAVRQLAALLDEEELQQQQQQQQQQEQQQQVPQSKAFYEEYPGLPAEADLLNQVDAKRAWRSLSNSGWGKRGDWSHFRGSWGKRDPSWTNLKGIWGKRSSNEDRIAE